MNSVWSEVVIALRRKIRQGKRHKLMGESGVPFAAQQLRNPTNIHEDVRAVPGLGSVV